MPPGERVALPRTVRTNASAVSTAASHGAQYGQGRRASAMSSSVTPGKTSFADFQRAERTEIPCAAGSARTITPASHEQRYGRERPHEVAHAMPGVWVISAHAPDARPFRQRP